MNTDENMMQAMTEKEEVLREALEEVYELSLKEKSEPVTEAVQGAHRSLSEIFAAGGRR